MGKEFYEGKTLRAAIAQQKVRDIVSRTPGTDRIALELESAIAAVARGRARAH